ncbi:hypothetical protein CBW42_02655 [Butyricicoccus porcorum]|uniref:Integrase catalytic domain-containing protein n=1 Tax=Butyricicoccus porcorum TaxID=1945634 RepID=A0A252F757_9FIRM|nr:hypothetical protein CBW42_02655 [Butyricicoccus porcorum]
MVASILDGLEFNHTAEACRLHEIFRGLLNRDFHAEKPNQKWVTDVTEFSLFGEKLYLSPILDLHSRDLVSYTISDRPVLGMVTSMLDKAFEKIPDDTGLILHSDQGWQYQHKQYQRMLKKKGVYSGSVVKTKI